MNADSHMEASRKITLYISGAHGAGKTTLLHALLDDKEFAKYSFKGQNEIARQWIAQKGYTQETLHDPDSFYKLQRELLEQQILAEQNEYTECSRRYFKFLWDRGPIDGIIYVKEFFGMEKVEECLQIPGVKEAIDRMKTDRCLVVVPKPEKEFNVKDGTRKESDLEEVMKIHNSTLETLKDLEIIHIAINDFSLNKRVECVVNEVKKIWPWIADDSPTNRSCW